MSKILNINMKAKILKAILLVKRLKYLKITFTIY